MRHLEVVVDCGGFVRRDARMKACAGEFVVLRELLTEGGDVRVLGKLFFLSSKCRGGDKIRLDLGHVTVLDPHLVPCLVRLPHGVL